MPQVVHVGAVLFQHLGKDSPFPQLFLSHSFFLELETPGSPEVLVLCFNASGATESYNTYFVGSEEAVAVELVAVALHAPAFMSNCELLIFFKVDCFFDKFF